MSKLYAQITDPVTIILGGRVADAPQIPPISNTGGTPSQPYKSLGCALIPSPKIFSAHIDFLTVTFRAGDLAAIYRKSESAKINQQNRNRDISPIAETCTDFEVAKFLTSISRVVSYLDWHDRSGGLFGYRRSMSLDRDGQPSGLFAWDGNEGTAMLSLSGAGCAGVHMPDLRRLLERLPGARITRVDFAHDDLDGDRSIDFWLQMAVTGSFASKGTAPSLRFIDDFGSGAGRTLYVGKKVNGKEACIYEKGKQLGDRDSAWVRVEGRLTNRDRVVPFESLVRPADYLAGLYPCFCYLSGNHAHVETLKKTGQISFKHLCHHAKLGYGKLIHVMRRGLDMTCEAICDALEREGIPSRLAVPFGEADTPDRHPLITDDLYNAFVNPGSPTIVIPA